MKLQRILFALLLSIQVGSVWGQSLPKGMNYQALVRDDSGNPLTNHTMTVQVSILEGGATGTTEFVERHTVISNEFGLFNIVVGGGIPVLNAFTNIDWSTGDQWMKVDVDLNAGNIYTTLSTTKLLSVPYALYAENATLSMDDLQDVDAVPVLDEQILKWDGIAWVPSEDLNTEYDFGAGLTATGFVVQTLPHTGDVSGLVDLTVVGLQGYSVSNATPLNGQILKWDAAINQWVPSPDANTLLTEGNGISITSGVISNSVWTQSGLNAIRTDGKVGIGTTSPSADLEVAGAENDGIESTLRLSSKTSPEYLLLDADEIDGSIGVRINKNLNTDVTLVEGGGKVGIVQDTPINDLDVKGRMTVGNLYSGTNLAPASGALIEGSVGVGTPTPMNKVDIAGNLAVGQGYAGSLSVPSDGAAIEGKVGIGTEVPQSKTDISGNLTVGAGYAGVNAGPLNGAIIEGNVGVGENAPINTVDVSGELAVGENYSGLETAPDNGAIIEGWLGVGTANPVTNFHVEGDAKISGSLDLGGDLTLRGKVRMLDTTQSYNDTTGALVVSGGVGIQKNTNIGGDLRVWNTTESTALDTGALIVDGGAGIRRRLNVGGITTIENITPSTLPTEGALQVQGGAGIVDRLNVGGVTTVWNTASSSDPTNGALRVSGGAGLGRELNVGSWAKIYSTLQSNNPTSGALTVDGGVGLQRNLHVGEDGFVNQNLRVGASIGVNINPSALYRLYVNGTGGYLRTANDGRTEIVSNNPGHSLSVFGPRNGIEIRVGAGTPNNTNNFITFKNNGGGTVGRIEGQTAADKLSDPRYIFETSMYAVDIAVATARLVATFGDFRVGVGFGFVTVTPGPVVIAASAGALASITAKAIAYQVFAFNNLGVTYSSGSGDYAEWLERIDQQEHMQPGDIIGVFGGKVTRNTGNAQQTMVVSTDPIVLGNMPADSNQLGSYEKVAFMGQVPVRVMGAVQVGDFIIPSGLNDGTGIAIQPEMMTGEEFAKIVGRAWSESNDPGVKLVNVAVGINQGDVATAVTQQERQNAQMMKRLTEMESTVSTLESQMLKMEKIESEAAELREMLDYLKSNGFDPQRTLEAKK